jgi:hypothetical protein
MLRTYGKQLTSAKRLARFRRALRLSRSQDEVTISREAKRRELVERIAREIIENLIVSNTDNPVVGSILHQLEHETGKQYVFEYPLDGMDVQILHDTQNGPSEVTGPERQEVMQRLWEITLARVDATML